jgi:type IV secretion system protein VirD4
MAGPSIYHIPAAQGDMTRIVWPALGLFLMITLLAVWGATEYAAWALQWTPALGAPIAAHAYAPWMIVIWSLKFDNPIYGQQVLDIFSRAHAAMGLGGLVALLVPVGYAYRRTGKAKHEQNDLHGSAHWAGDPEVKGTGLMPGDDNRGGVYLGAYVTKDGKIHYLRHAGPEHIMVFAPTRSGKGVGIVIPTLLSWLESVFVYDIKGENWALTSGFREKVLGQRVIKFDPANPGSARFNPLKEIRTDGNLVKDVQNIATMIVDPDGKGLNDHWAKTGFDLLTGVILFVLLTKDLREEERCLATVQAILSDGGPVRHIAEEKAKEKARNEAAEAKEKGQKAPPVPTGFQAVIAYIRDTALVLVSQGSEVDPHRLTGWRSVAEASQSFLNKAPNESSGVLSTALSFLSLYRDPIVAENTRVSDFSLESLMGGRDVDGKPCLRRTALYVVVPPSDKDRLKPLLRLLLNQVVRRLTEGMDFDEGGRSKSLYPFRMLLLLDEFPSLGKLDVFQEALAFIAGYGLKALIIVQDLSQLFAAYGKDESIISNCHIRVAYAPNKVETAELLSKMSGQATVSHTQRQYSGNRLAVLLQHVNTNEQIVQRPLLTADEAMRLPPDDEIIFVAGFAPVYCQKIKYYLDETFQVRVALKCASTTGRGTEVLPMGGREAPVGAPAASVGAGSGWGTGQDAGQGTTGDEDGYDA